ncbi:hypothetical protein [Devosia sp.]|uniref:hypothetical protein n=1 Tax=Devosia sp. TaxID=1871048 RepID=UPI0032655E7B
MTDTAIATEQTCRPGFFARLRRWLASRPSSRQRRATIDLRTASATFKRDLGIETLTL